MKNALKRTMKFRIKSIEQNSNYTQPEQNSHLHFLYLANNDFFKAYMRTFRLFFFHTIHSFEPENVLNKCLIFFFRCSSHLKSFIDETSNLKYTYLTHEERQRMFDSYANV